MKGFLAGVIGVLGAWVVQRFSECGLIEDGEMLLHELATALVKLRSQHDMISHRIS